MIDPRRAALDVLSRWTNLPAPPAVPERGDALWKGLAARDRAFAFDLVNGVVRWRGLLDAVIDSRLRATSRSLETKVRTILWMGAYQLLVQSGTADYAAVDTAVTLARHDSATVRAGGLINAVLRGITRLKPTREPYDGSLGAGRFSLDFSTSIRFSEAVFIDPKRDLAGHLAQVRSHPVELVRHLLNQLQNPDPSRPGIVIPGPTPPPSRETIVAQILLRNNLRPYITVRADDSAFIPSLEAGLVPLADAPGFFVAADGWNRALEKLIEMGVLSPQDRTAAGPVLRARELAAAGAIVAPKTILDFCAGLGTKTIQLARAFPEAQVTAADIDPPKLHRLLARAKRLGLANVRANLAGAVERAGKTFDLVLADVPCSNSGVMARRVQSRWRWPTLDHKKLRQLQRHLLKQAMELTAAGGSTIYATCSIDPAENVEIAKATGATPIEQSGTIPSLTDDPAQSHDGGYFAIFKREGST